LRWCLLDQRDDPLERLTRAAVGKVTPAVLSHRVREIMNVDVRKALANLKQPLLVMQGRQDKVVPTKNAQQMKALAPHAKLEEMDGPHLLLQTRSAQCCEKIATFLCE
jgi:pimeloyl-ACP methyl ester carboxylesterase